jgi:hypothetical protein
MTPFFVHPLRPVRVHRKKMAEGLRMKSFILLFAMIACLASPLYATSDITLWLTVNEINSTTQDVNLFAKATAAPLTQIDGAQWAIAYNTAANTTTIGSVTYSFAGDWSPTITLQSTSIGSYNQMISWIGFGADKTIGSSAGGTLLATVRFTKAGADWGTGHVVTEAEGDGFGTIITNNTVQQTLSYPPSDVSLPVQMTEITAAASAKEGIVLTWSTESEVNSAGFFVWRSEAETGEYRKISAAFIPGRGNSSSRTGYRFSDPDAAAGKTYWYKIEAVSMDGKSEFHGPVSASIRDRMPTEFSLSQNFPNPFNPVTEAGYELPEASPVLIRVYSILGKEITILVNQTKQAGRYKVPWDGTDGHGALVPSGIYFLQMEAGGYTIVRKMTYLR